MNYLVILILILNSKLTTNQPSYSYSSYSVDSIEIYDGQAFMATEIKNKLECLNTCSKSSFCSSAIFNISTCLLNREIFSSFINQNKSKKVAFIKRS